MFSDNLQGVAYSDKDIGENVQRFRRLMTQTELATAMKELGHRWSQPTVVAVEKGDRALRFSEAVDLAEILGIRLTDLTRTAPHAAYAVEKRAIEKICEELGELSVRLDDARGNLSYAFGFIRNDVSDVDSKTLAWLLTASLDTLAQAYNPQARSMSEELARQDGERQAEA